MANSVFGATFENTANAVNNSGEVFRKVLKRIRPHGKLLAGSILCAALSVGLTLYIPILIGKAVDAIIGPGKVDFGSIFEILKQILVFTALNSVSQWLMNLCNNKMTYAIVNSLRNEAISKIQLLPLDYLDHHSQGDTLSRVISDVDQFADGLLLGFTQLFTGIATIIGTLCFMLSLDKKITLLVVIITPLSLFVASFIAKRTFSMFRAQSEARGEQTSLIDEMLGNPEVVKAFGYETRAMERFDAINERLSDASLKATFFSSITNPATRFVNSVVYAVVTFGGASAALHGRITVGQLSSFLSYANQYTKPFNEISGVVTEFQSALACASRVFELLEETPEPADPADAVVLDHVDGTVELRDVAFSYDEKQSLIEDLSLSVRPGQRVAIVGPTGSGKTTIINLLMRFYDVRSGSVNVMGTDIRRITRKSLRENYGMVLQDTWLKNGTIRENIAMGDPSADEKAIIEAAKLSHAHGFIRRLPKGYDTVISEDGSGLSQGQKQLLCIARIMLTLPPMLILDEATSSIDTRTELLIQNAFARLMKGRTGFIVAHRLSTVREADVILVMKDGKIIEKGSHEELLAANGFYTKLYSSQ